MLPIFVTFVLSAFALICISLMVTFFMKLLTHPPKILSENQIYQLTLWFRVLGVLFVCFLAFWFFWSFFCNMTLIFLGFQILPLKIYHQKGFWKIEKGKPR